MIAMQTASAPGAGPSTSLSGSGAAGPPRPLSHLRHSRSGQGDAPQLEKKPEFQQREKPAARGRKRAHSAAKEGGLLLGLEVVSDLAVDLVGDAISDLFS